MLVSCVIASEIERVVEMMEGTSSHTEASSVSMCSKSASSVPRWQRQDVPCHHVSRVLRGEFVPFFTLDAEKIESYRAIRMLGESASCASSSIGRSLVRRSALPSPSGNSCIRPSRNTSNIPASMRETCCISSRCDMKERLVWHFEKLDKNTAGKSAP